MCRCLCFTLFVLIQLIFISRVSSLDGNTTSPFNLYTRNETSQWIPLDPMYVPKPVDYPNTFLLTYSPFLSPEAYNFNNLAIEKRGQINWLIQWLSPSEIVSTIPTERGPPDPNLADDNVTESTLQECKVLYGCLYLILAQYLEDQDPVVDTNFYLEEEFSTCVLAGYDKVLRPAGLNKPLACFMIAQNTRDLSQLGYSNCASTNIPLSRDLWDQTATDASLQSFIESGPDSAGIWWQGLVPVISSNQSLISEHSIEYWPQETLSFSSALGRQTLGDSSFQCSLENSCRPVLGCETAGSYLARALGKEIQPAEWALFALTALKNINTQLSNQYIALKGSAIVATLRAFSIGDYYPKPDQKFSILNAIQGLSSAFAILSGFGPFAGPLGSSSAAIGAVGAYLGRYVGASAAAAGDTTTKTYADSVEVIYTSLVQGLDAAATALLNGSSLDGGFNILDMMRGGAWLNTEALQQVSNIEEQLRIEIICRSINALWKTKPSNKVFVLFVDLGDDDSKALCLADRSGPQMLKYCGDRGVYYAYNFVEDGKGIGHLGLPWGADKMLANLRIDPAVRIRSLSLMPLFPQSLFLHSSHHPLHQWITEASARTYRTAKATPGLDPFNFDTTTGTAAFINITYNSNSTTVDDVPILDLKGRYPGTWTLPVCDAGTWGKAWNWDFINSTVTKEIQLLPCLCGKLTMMSESTVWPHFAATLASLPLLQHYLPSILSFCSTTTALYPSPSPLIR